ncbi:hypothetical protein E8E12_004798 [Didymella heteroderae]|uniref:MYND-type domain-containing protein n=1 Tax=Didymella heteroderae TaxID=1769908 RepID=A0A9P4WXN8_9PLEO|nr:hypothetical protein E8E12_004798 [Didymella heteroderae]
MKYCSRACQKRDWKLHKTLCDQFKNFQDEHRPSPDHRRVIFFPPDKDSPRFVWLKYKGSRKCMFHDVDDFRKYIPGMATPISHFDSYRELGRQWNTTFWIQQHDPSAHLPVNRSLIQLLDQYAARWRDPVICMAPLKYGRVVEWDDYDEEDKNLDCPDVLLPYDLDTTSLAVHVACLRFRSKYECTGCEYGINAEGVGDGFDPK